MTSYLTVAGSGSGSLEVKRSRFLATVERADSEGAAREAVERQRRRHWDARHHCSAFVIGPERALQRSSDDGEPAGTAGAPMLEVLRGAGVSDTVAVVTRWFGGVLLGAGGLVRAYGDAVRAALADAGTLRRTLVREYAVTLDHADAGRVESELRSRGIRVLGTTWTDRVVLTLGVTGDGERLAAVLAELTSGAAVPVEAGQNWVDGPPVRP